ncbi:hypothetical protein B9J09_05335 [Xylella fastidiosa subsp. pauca]|uniref:hypothetical protein n=1 Tax=Xylella fastidiosa TaxID=2371 RepID=UPI0007660078|nr:hypothetical protein [Xylella fastidiosa]ARO68525.1 hypothetical protein B9J09_05335 [Xylella fastidiosa subsp. pauca]AVI20637.1 hypothetical protein BCV75_04955 [Xylella fastidiosa]AVI22662.1 hypothetical protein BC375_05015 [Xylella fastidiosa]KXB11247.1 hypothetical protein ADT32_06090 [Xylella fastidiosa]KXB18073.1 hypothetical protein ADT33_00040 [Xylella fastidiosa]
MLEVVTRNPHDGMSSKSLGKSSAVSKRLLLASISKLVQDLDSVKDRFENLKYESCGIQMYSERRYVANRINEAAEWVARFLGDVDADLDNNLEDDLDV